MFCSFPLCSFFYFLRIARASILVFEFLSMFFSQMDLVLI